MAVRRTLVEQIRHAWQDIASVYVSTPHPGAPYTGLFRPAVWERMHPDDVKYAVKMATRQYLQSWKRARPGDEPAAQAPQQQTPSEPPIAPLISSEDVKSLLRKLATRSGDAYNDPAVQAKLQEIMGRGIGTLRGVVDAFLVGYAEGKNEEIRRALDEEIARQRAAIDALRAAHAEAGVAPGPPGGVAAGPAAGTGVTATAAASSGPPSAGGHPDTRGASPTGEVLPSSHAGGLRDAPPAAPR